METEIITLNLQSEPTATSPGSSVLSSLPCSTPSSSFATAADLESMLTLPATPRLLLLGERTSGRIEHWMVSLEGHII
ncbi:hypothetical protein MHYP_G00310570 [Metynnis hypsauchen]